MNLEAAGTRLAFEIYEVVAENEAPRHTRTEAFVGQPYIKVGDLPTSHLRLEGASRTHAVVEVDRDGVRIIDLGSWSGVRVNERKTAMERLKTGDTIEIGRWRLVLQIGAEGP